jgi:SNF2 family DNA or RNA helicase
MEVHFCPAEEAWSEWLAARTAVAGENAQVLLRQGPGLVSEEEGDLLLARLRPGLELYPHQVRAVRRVLGELAGRAILADGVGLGKTVEAGAVLAEYWWRGVVRRALVLTPAALVRQWTGELATKFGLEATVARTAADWAGDLVVGSLDQAKRPAHARTCLGRRWDLVIVDEAHRLRNQQTANWQFVHQLSMARLLLLTATPVQNDLRELYNLLTLVRPGYFSTPSEFRRTFRAERLAPRNPELLRERLKGLMLRTDRSEARGCFPPRRVATLTVPLVPGEEELYSACLDLLAEARARRRTRQQLLPLVTLLREATSSPEAARRTLLRMARTAGIPEDLAERYRAVAAQAKGLPCGKAARLRDLVAGRREKVIVFTEFRASQDVVARELAAVGVRVAKYHGGMSPAEQEAAVEAFRGPARALVATEAGAEGHNLQFCRWLVNYDLPWNPMRLEQRIGRVHRLGQCHQVEIINLATEGTIESHVLGLLGEKLELCEEVLGELDLVLEHGLERRLADLVLAAERPADLTEGFARLAEEIAARRAALAASGRCLDQLLRGRPRCPREEGAPWPAVR